MNYSRFFKKSIKDFVLFGKRNLLDNTDLPMSSNFLIHNTKPIAIQYYKGVINLKKKDVFHYLIISVKTPHDLKVESSDFMNNLMFNYDPRDYTSDVLQTVTVRNLDDEIYNKSHEFDVKFSDRGDHSAFILTVKAKNKYVFVIKHTDQTNWYDDQAALAYLISIS